MSCYAWHGMACYSVSPNNFICTTSVVGCKGQTIIWLLIISFVCYENIMWQHKPVLQSKIDNHTICRWEFRLFSLWQNDFASAIASFLRWFYGKTCPHISTQYFDILLLLFSTMFFFLSFSIFRNLCAMFFVCLF